MKKLTIILMLCFCMYGSEAYAQFDIPGAVQEGMEKATDFKTKIEEYKNKIEEVQKRIKEGFDKVGGCISNPGQCAMGALSNLSLDGYAENSGEFAAFMQDSGLDKGDLNKYASKEMEDAVKEVYTYKRGAGKDLEKLKENRQGLNFIVINDTNALFAKGVTTHHSVMAEDGSLYELKDSENIENVLTAQATVDLFTQYRLARMLELRANMVGAEATVELVQQSHEGEK